MDPQKLSQLDPKLRDAYQRVMGTVIPETQPSAQPQTPDPIQRPPTANGNTILSPKPQLQPAPPIVQPVAKPQPLINPQPQPIQAQQAPQQAAPAQPTPNFARMNSEIPTTTIAPAVAPANPNFSAPAPQAQTMVIKKKSSGIMPIIFFFVGLIFIVIYTLFWTKIFNLKLPFLP